MVAKLLYRIYFFAVLFFTGDDFLTDCHQSTPRARALGIKRPGVYVPSSKHWTTLPMNEAQLTATLSNESGTTPEHRGVHAAGTPRRVQQAPWFRPPAPHLISLWSSAPQNGANPLTSVMFASNEHRGMHICRSLMFTQQSVRLYGDAGSSRSRTICGQPFVLKAFRIT